MSAEFRQKFVKNKTICLEATVEQQMHEISPLDNSYPVKIPKIQFMCISASLNRV